MMKSGTWLLVAGLVAGPAVAAPKVKYECVSKTSGFRYVVYPAYGEIHEYDERGRYIGHQDSMTPRTRILKTNPVTRVTEFVHEEGDVVFTIREQGKTIRAEYDDDYRIYCTKKLVTSVNAD